MLVKLTAGINFTNILQAAFKAKVPPAKRHYFKLKYSQTCVQRPTNDPKFMAVVYMWSLFRGSFML